MIKKLARSIREFKRDTILTPIFMMLEVVMEVIIPLLTASLIDYGIEKGDINHVLKIGIALVGCALISMFFGICGGQKAAMASSGFARNLRHDLYHKFQSFSFGNIDKFSNASLITRMTTDVNNVQMAFQMLIRMAIRSPITLIFSCIMAFSINSTVSLIFLGCAPVLALGLYLIMTHAHPLFKKVFRTYDKLNRIVQENLRGVRVVKSFVRNDHEIGKFNDVSDEIYSTFTRAEKLIAFNGPLMQLCLNTCLLLIAWIGAHLIVASGNDPAVGMTTGQLMSLITYAMQILMSLMMLSMVFVMLTISRTSAERIVEVLDEESSIVSPADPVTCVKDGSVEFDGVSFSYSGDIEKLCLKNVNISIESGQTIGIVGGTGSSKSTLVQLIARLYDVTCGTLRVGGVDVRDYDLTLLRDSVAMVLQKNTLFSGTIKENLRWGNEEATDEQLVEACRLACADGFITQFPDGYDTYIEQGGTNVSGGQRQRLCIARALLKNPKIIILDDSTSAVDTATDSAIRTAFKDYIPHVTKFIIAQRIASVKDADRIIVMENGEVNDFGTHEELLGRNAVYREIYDSQNKGGIGQ